MNRNLTLIAHRTEVLNLKRKITALEDAGDKLAAGTKGLLNIARAFEVDRKGWHEEINAAYSAIQEWDHIQ